MNVHQSRAKRLLELQDLLVRFAEIERMIHFPDRKKKDRQENDAEHSYSLAMAAWFLAGHFPHLNRDKLIRYALVHDLVEVHAGDEMAIGRTIQATKTKKQREKKALEQLKQDWPDFAGLTETIEQYEERQDSESKFIYTLDKLMPMMLNILSGGKTWRAYRLKKTDVLANKDSAVTFSPELDELWQVFRKEIAENGDYFKHEDTAS